MTHPSPDEISLYSIGSALLRWRWTIIGLGVMGGVVAGALGLTGQRMYLSTATFIPEASERGMSAFALAASQFGLRLPGNDAGWGPQVYVELLRSRALLEPIAQETVTVVEEGGRRAAVMDLLNIPAISPERRTELTASALRGTVKAREEVRLGAVRVLVTTRWPSVSLALAQRLVLGVNQFNLETRKSQAAAERQFVEAQAEGAEGALREAEGRLQVFLRRNRVIDASTELGFERDRLQREVNLRQQVYTSLVQSREEAKIREVRDTPVITMLEEPRRPVIPESRRVKLKGMLGGIAGVMLGALIGFVAEANRRARRQSNQEAQEFFQLVDETTPRFMKRDKR